MLNIIWFTLFLSIFSKKNISHPRIPLGCISASLLSFIWLHLLELPDSSLISFYNYAVIGYALSAIVELLSEPLFVIGQVLLFIRIKVNYNDKIIQIFLSEKILIKRRNKMWLVSVESAGASCVFLIF